MCSRMTATMKLQGSYNKATMKNDCYNEERRNNPLGRLESGVRTKHTLQCAFLWFHISVERCKVGQNLLLVGQGGKKLVKEERVAQEARKGKG